MKCPYCNDEMKTSYTMGSTLVCDKFLPLSDSPNTHYARLNSNEHYLHVKKHSCRIERVYSHYYIIFGKDYYLGNRMAISTFKFEDSYKIMIKYVNNKVFI